MSSERQLQRQIDKLRFSPLLTPPRVTFLLSDRKSFNLKQQVRVNPESFLHFWCESGATAGNRLQFLKDNLQHELQNLNLITLYVWVGTCNFTQKEGHFIYVVSKDNSTVDNLISELKEIYHFTRQFENQVKLVFLHIPLFSIYEHNVYRNLQDKVEQFKDKDILLHAQISAVIFILRTKIVSSTLIHQTFRRIYKESKNDIKTHLHVIHMILVSIKTAYIQIKH
jgi:hypothetical protein